MFVFRFLLVSCYFGFFVSLQSAYGLEPDRFEFEVDSRLGCLDGVMCNTKNGNIRVFFASGQEGLSFEQLQKGKARVESVLVPILQKGFVLKSEANKELKIFINTSDTAKIHQIAYESALDVGINSSLRVIESSLFNFFEYNYSHRDHKFRVHLKRLHAENSFYGTREIARAIGELNFYLDSIYAIPGVSLSCSFFMVHVRPEVPSDWVPEELYDRDACVVPVFPGSPAGLVNITQEKVVSKTQRISYDFTFGDRMIRTVQGKDSASALNLMQFETVMAEIDAAFDNLSHSGLSLKHFLNGTPLGKNLEIKIRVSGMFHKKTRTTELVTERDLDEGDFQFETFRLLVPASSSSERIEGAIAAIIGNTEPLSFGVTMRAAVITKYPTGRYLQMFGGPGLKEFETKVKVVSRILEEFKNQGLQPKASFDIALYGSRNLFGFENHKNSVVELFSDDTFERVEATLLKEFVWPTIH